MSKFLFLFLFDSCFYTNTFAYHSSLEKEARIAERAANEANKELQAVETSINLTKANIAKLKKDSEGEFFFFLLLLVFKRQTI